MHGYRLIIICTSSQSSPPSGEGINESMEHYLRVSAQQEADDLLSLQAVSSPKRPGSKSVYEYQEVPEGRSEFSFGGNTGRLTRIKRFFKFGHKKRGEFETVNTLRYYNINGQNLAIILGAIVYMPRCACASKVIYGSVCGCLCRLHAAAHRVLLYST